MDADQYVEILNNHLLPSLADSGIDGEEYIGFHSLRALILLNTSGNISKCSWPSMKHQQKESGRFGRVW